MSALREGLAAISERELIEATSKGLLRRARRDLEKGVARLISEEEERSISFSLSPD